MKLRQLLTLLLLFVLNSISMVNAGDKLVTPNQVKVQVKGVVCSFCAHGTEKNLAELDFLDKSQFGEDGVLIDIHTHQITLALQPSKPVGYADIAKAIIKGGYDPVAYYVALQGVIEKSSNGYQLLNKSNRQVYILPNTENVSSKLGKPILVTTELSAEQAASSSSSQPVHLAKIKLELQP